MLFLLILPNISEANDLDINEIKKISNSDYCFIFSLVDENNIIIYKFGESPMFGLFEDEALEALGSLRGGRLIETIVIYSSPKVREKTKRIWISNIDTKGLSTPGKVIFLIHNLEKKFELPDSKVVERP
jgi:hypothetical protein